MTWDARDTQRMQPKGPRKRIAPTDAASSATIPMTPAALPTRTLADLYANEPWGEETDRQDIQRAYHSRGWWTHRDLERARRLMTRGIQPYESAESDV